jgi:hypothetical protein
MSIQEQSVGVLFYWVNTSAAVGSSLDSCQPNMTLSLIGTLYKFSSEIL